MAVGEQSIEGINAIKGVTLGAVEAHIKYQNKKDLVVIKCEAGSTLAGVFTQNRFCAAPVQIAKKHLRNYDTTQAGYLLINTGYANAGTGQKGYDNGIKTCQMLADEADVALTQVLPFSTGVIGENFAMSPFESGIPKALQNLGETQWLEAAYGIMTTDTRPKVVSKQISLDGRIVTITGISKGAGMICPNMATMLSFVATDAVIDRTVLQTLLSEATEQSFNRITIDGDTSTNDSCIAMATGQSGVAVDDADKLTVFKTAFDALMLELALAIVKDGEGATKCVAICVKSAHCRQEALDVAYTIAHSPLVKTALFASDPNWGRIVAAIGRAPMQGSEELDVNRVAVFLGDVQLVANGGLAESYQEAAASAVMQEAYIDITVELNRGTASETVWTTDFSYDYVKINAEYRS